MMIVETEIEELKARLARAEMAIYIVGGLCTFLLIVTCFLAIGHGGSIARLQARAENPETMPPPVGVASAPDLAPVTAPDPEIAAVAASTAEIKALYLPEHFVMAGSTRVLTNREARGLRSVFVGGQEIEIKHRHLPADVNHIVVTGVLDVGGDKEPFIAYLKFDPASGRYRKLDIDVLSP